MAYDQCGTTRFIGKLQMLEIAIFEGSSSDCLREQLWEVLG